MSLTVSSMKRFSSGNQHVTQGTIAFDSSYPTGGESLTPNNVGLSVIDDILIHPSSGYTFEYDYANNLLLAYSASTVPSRTGTINDNNDAATQGGAVYAIPQSRTAAIATPALGVNTTLDWLITDSDTAATAGVAIYVVVDEADWHPNYALGHFEFVSPTNADGSGTLTNGGGTYHVRDDDDAATNGVVIRAKAAAAGIEATTAASKDILVPTSLGTFIHVNHGTTGSTPIVYFDEDASNSYERALAVVVDNADEPTPLWSAVTADASELAADVWYSENDLYDLVHADTGKLTYAVGSGGPTVVIQGRPDAAALPGAVVVGARAAGAGLDAALPSGRNGYVPLSNGEYIEIIYAATPTGVALYANPAAASTDLTLECVVVDNADETFTVSTTKSQRVDAALAGSQVANATDLSALTAVRWRAVGH